MCTSSHAGPEIYFCVTEFVGAVYYLCVLVVKVVIFPLGNCVTQVRLCCCCLFFKGKDSHKCFTHVSSHLSPPIHDFDVFKESKEENFFESQESIDTLCLHLQQLRPARDLSEDRLKEEFLRLLQVSGWFSYSVCKQCCGR